MSKLPAMMRAVEIKKFGPAEGLTLTERPVPHHVSYTHLRAHETEDDIV